MAELDPFKEQNVNIDALPQQDSRYGSDVFRDVKELQVGGGTSVFRANESGIWLGADAFANAPFRVDMAGNVTASSIALTGYVATGGAAADVNSNTTTISGGKITANTITASQLSTALLYAGVITIDTNGQIKGGMTGYNSGAGFFLGMSGGLYKFAVGDSAGSKMLWDGSALTITGNITGSTITGSTLTTATSGQRVVLTSTLAQFYNSSGTEIVDTYASASSYLIKGIQTASSIVLDTGASGTVAFLSNGTSKMIFDGGNAVLAPFVDGGISLGASVFQFLDVFLSRNLTYRGVVQNIVYTGLGSGTTISKTNGFSWTLTNPATGQYTITHGLNTTNYTVLITPKASTVKLVGVDLQSSTAFSIRIANTALTLENNDFYFTLFLNP